MKEGVRTHRHFLLLLTKGYFTREFCKLELRTAFDTGRKLILVHETSPERGGYASFGSYIDELKEQMQDDELYADFPEAKDWIFGVDSIPLYHEYKFDVVSLTRILARVGLAEPPSNASLLAAASRVPEDACLTMLTSSSAMPQATTAVADMRRVCRTLACTFSATDESHLVVLFVTQEAVDEFSDLVVSLQAKGRRVIALCQVDERKGYDGVQRHVLSADERWQDVELLPWSVYSDFRYAALTQVLVALGEEARRVGILVNKPILESADGADNVDPDMRMSDILRQLEDAQKSVKRANERCMYMQHALERKDRTNRILEAQLMRSWRMLASRPSSPPTRAAYVANGYISLPRLNRRESASNV